MKEINCNWAVCYDIPGTSYDDGKARTQTIAVFRYPFNADSFIQTMPEETRSRFYVKRLSKVTCKE